MKTLALTTTAADLTDTPFIPGRDAVAVNFGAAAVTVQDGAGTTLVTVPAAGMANVPKLPTSIKASAACFLLGGV